MKHNSPVITRYIKGVKSAFPTYGSAEKNYIHNLEIHLNEYVDEHPDCSEENLITEFGTPTSVIADYISGMDEQILYQRLKRQDIKRRIIKSCIIITILLNVFLFYLAYQDYRYALTQNIVYEETIIEED